MDAWDKFAMCMTAILVIFIMTVLAYYVFASKHINSYYLTSDGIAVDIENDMDKHINMNSIPLEERIRILKELNENLPQNQKNPNVNYSCFYRKYPKEKNKMNHSEICPVCNGKGKIPDDSTKTSRDQTCHGCNGRGWVAVQGCPQHRETIWPYIKKSEEITPVPNWDTTYNI